MEGDSGPDTERTSKTRDEFEIRVDQCGPSQRRPQLAINHHVASSRASTTFNRDPSYSYSDGQTDFRSWPHRDPSSKHLTLPRFTKNGETVGKVDEFLSVLDIPLTAVLNTICLWRLLQELSQHAARHSPLTQSTALLVTCRSHRLSSIPSSEAY
ncbi:hypothetical protein B0H12DRAFT_547958 [Mycena haematopus]|nr:hypothetical protein B0H12DRAFT_547958 [Mycena haematopus]